MTDLYLAYIKNSHSARQQYFFKEHMQITNKHMKKCPPSVAIRELQIKGAIRYPFTLNKMARMKKTDKY